LLSVSDKRGLIPFAHELVRLGVQLFSTGGTAKALQGAGIDVATVEQLTGSPEVLGGRVKTLHPRVHAAILARASAEDAADLQSLGVQPLDLVVVNLYPFVETVARGAGFAETIEEIDIGGVALLRAAAKNHERVAVAAEPDDYTPIVDELRGQGGLSLFTRRRLAAKAFAQVARYDVAIAQWFDSAVESAAGPSAQGAPLGERLELSFHESRGLRYGENPHQAARVYVDPRCTPAVGGSLATATVLQGKELSYNNYLDLDAALGLAMELPDTAAVVVKHTNPCGVATRPSLVEAYRLARDADPISAFGGIVAFNREVDESTAALLSETFLECIVAPGFAPAAVGALSAKRSLRLVAVGPWHGAVVSATPPLLRSIRGGVLVQQADTGQVDWSAAKCVTRRPPSGPELSELQFAWLVAKHVKSNAIVVAKDGVTLGVGCGQTSRLDSVRSALSRAGAAARGAVLASDAFFPFRDGLDEAAKAGVAAVAQPGGSVRDAEVIAAADEHGMAMVFTSLRHFRH
jgi:phosphoribosylaminoimidazolecarboxamide formyltransferase/IMP cyclohydrolase